MIGAKCDGGCAVSVIADESASSGGGAILTYGRVSMYGVFD